MSEREGYACMYCGGELEECSNYKWDCPNDCFQVDMELCYMISEEDGGIGDEEHIIYQYKNKKHKDMLIACYFLQHPKETKVTEQDLNNWLLQE
jgi:hypothetical protein